MSVDHKDEVQKDKVCQGQDYHVRCDHEPDRLRIAVVKVFEAISIEATFRVSVRIASIGNRMLFVERRLIKEIPVHLHEIKAEQDNSVEGKRSEKQHPVTFAVFDEHENEGDNGH